MSMTDHEAKLIGVSAAWEVWSGHLLETRRIAGVNAACGDYATADQERRANELLLQQHYEAYARARVQIAIAEALDGLDTSAEFDEHWKDFWGTRLAEVVATKWATEFAATRTAIIDRREAARAQAGAMRAQGL